MYLAILLINCIFQWFFVLDKLKQRFLTESRLHVWLAYPPGRSMNLYKNALVYLINCWVARKRRKILEDCIFHVYLSIFFFENLFFNFSILRNSKINWKNCLWGIFHISPYYKFLKWDIMVLTVGTSTRWLLETLCHTLYLY